MAVVTKKGWPELTRTKGIWALQTGGLASPEQRTVENFRQPGVANKHFWGNMARSFSVEFYPWKEH